LRGIRVPRTDPKRCEWQCRSVGHQSARSWQNPSDREVAGDLAVALGLLPTALLATVAASDHGITSRAVLMQAINELAFLGPLDTVSPASAQSTDNPHPTSVKAALTHAQVQKFKAQRLTQVEVTGDVGIPRSTVQRHWH